MTGYIIDPKVFYWINTLDTLKSVTAALAITLGIASIILLVFVIISWVDEDDEFKTLKKLTIILLSIALVFTIVAIFIPNKQTSVEMLVAKTATIENVDWSVAQIKEIVDYIVKAVEN